MGVERAVTRWYAQRQVILDEIAALQASLTQHQQAQKAATGQSSEGANAGAGKRANVETIAEIERKLAEAQSRLRELGPCPKTMMG